jgi:hypothetical protein
VKNPTDSQAQDRHELFQARSRKTAHHRSEVELDLVLT